MKLIKEYKEKTMVEKIKESVLMTRRNVHKFLSNLWEFLTASSMLVVAGHAAYCIHNRIHGLDALMIVGIAAVVTGIAGLGAFYRFLNTKE